TFLLAPSLIAWLDRDASSRRASHRLGPKRAGGGGTMQALARLVTRHPAPLLAAAAVLTAVAAVELRTVDRRFIAYDFSKLRRADSRVSGAAYWGAKMDDLLGRYLTPIVLFTDSRDQAARLSAGMKRAITHEPLSGIVDSVVDIDDVVPRDQAP